MNTLSWVTYYLDPKFIFTHFRKHDILYHLQARMDGIKNTEEKHCGNNIKFINNEFVLTVREKGRLGSKGREVGKAFLLIFLIPFYIILIYFLFFILIFVYFSYLILWTRLWKHFKNDVETRFFLLLVKLILFLFCCCYWCFRFIYICQKIVKNFKKERKLETINTIIVFSYESYCHLNYPQMSNYFHFKKTAAITLSKVTSIKLV